MFALALLSLLPAAHALDCAVGIADSLPRDAATNVPVNARPIVQTFGEPLVATGSAEGDLRALRLVHAETGAVVPASVQALTEGTRRTYQLSPTSELAADTPFRLEAIAPGGDAEPIAEFRTGDLADWSAPASATIDHVAQTTDEDTWGTWQAFTIDLSPVTDASGVRYQVELADNAAFEGALLRTSLSSAVELQDNPCSLDEAAALAPEATWVRVTAIDLADNPSSEAVAEPGEVGEAGLGCAVAGGRGLRGLGVGLALFGLAIRRRRA